jgi:tripartite-type tricarboxylate transporter receptor subunit TctC
MRRRTFVSAIPLAGSLAAWAPAALRAAESGEGAYPAHPLTFVVAYTPGSANDILVRIVSPAFERELKQSIVVQNRPGAGGTLGMAMAARAKPDGYTLALGSTATVAINRALYSNLSYDPLNDFTPVIAFGSTPNVLVVPGSSAIRSIADLKAAAAAGALNYSSPGNGTTQHLAGVLFERFLPAGSNLAHVPFKGPAEQVAALAGGQVDFGFASLPASLALIQGGKLRALGVTPLAPVATLPGVPSLSASGLSGFDNAGVWFGLVVPAGTPQPVVAALHAAGTRALARSDVQDQLMAAGYDPAPPASSEAFAHYVQDQVRFWGDLVKRSGARVD